MKCLRVMLLALPMMLLLLLLPLMLPRSIQGPILHAADARAEAGTEVIAKDEFQLFYDNPVAVYGREVRYDVFRNDKKIGEHTLVFDRGGDTLLVTGFSQLVVRYLGVPVYRYSYSAKEIWIAGKLSSVESEIRDNRKKPRMIKAVKQGRVLEVTDRGKSRLAPMVEFATTYWHPGALSESRMFHTTHGKVRNVKVQQTGRDKVALHDTASASVRAVDATHYKLTGGFAAELWYDRHSRWIRLQFRADDGSLIDYKCTTCGEP